MNVRNFLGMDLYCTKDIWQKRFQVENAEFYISRQIGGRGKQNFATHILINYRLYMYVTIHFIFKIRSFTEIAAVISFQNTHRFITVDIFVFIPFSFPLNLFFIYTVPYIHICLFFLLFFWFLSFGLGANSSEI